MKSLLRMRIPSKLSMSSFLRRKMMLHMTKKIRVLTFQLRKRRKKMYSLYQKSSSLSSKMNKWRTNQDMVKKKKKRRRKRNQRSYLCPVSHRLQENNLAKFLLARVKSRLENPQAGVLPARVRFPLLRLLARALLAKAKLHLRSLLPRRACLGRQALKRQLIKNR